MFGGKISYVSDLIGNRALESSFSHYAKRDYSFTEAKVKLLSPLYRDNFLNISSVLQYQNLSFDTDNNFESITLSFQPDLWYVDPNIGLGVNEFGESSEQVWGLLFGISKDIKLAQFRYIPLEATAIIWGRNLQFNIYVEYRIFRRYRMELGYQYFNGVGLFQINLGNSIRLWRIPKAGYGDI